MNGNTIPLPPPQKEKREDYNEWHKKSCSMCSKREEPKEEMKWVECAGVGDNNGFYEYTPRPQPDTSDWEEPEEFLNRIFSRAHIPEYAHDAKFTILGYIRQAIAHARELGTKEGLERGKEYEVEGFDKGFERGKKEGREETGREKVLRGIRDGKAIERARIVGIIKKQEQETTEEDWTYGDTEYSVDAVIHGYNAALTDLLNKLSAEKGEIKASLGELEQ